MKPQRNEWQEIIYQYQDRGTIIIKYILHKT